MVHFLLFCVNIFKEGAVVAQLIVLQFCNPEVVGSNLWHNEMAKSFMGSLALVTSESGSSRKYKNKE